MDKMVISRRRRERVPIWRCRRCSKYTSACPLSDLNPCAFERRVETENMGLLLPLLAALAGAVISCLILFTS